jgi:hypothetical protein
VQSRIAEDVTEIIMTGPSPEPIVPAPDLLSFTDDR